MQYQAGYLLEAVREQLQAYANVHGKEASLNGLLRSLSTCAVQTRLSLDTPAAIPPHLAVAVNILTRGLPTLASITTEQYFARQLGLTQHHDDLQRGRIGFSFLQGTLSPDTAETFYKALHTVDPRAKDRMAFLDLSNTDSGFERNFLLQLLPEQHSYLAQLLEKQRSRSSLTRDNNAGRVDFSLEIPYDFQRVRTNRYNSQVQIKHNKTYVIEVDGKKYHTDFIDDQKDFEIAQLSRTVSHITEDRVHQDVHDFIRAITQEPYVKQAAANYTDDTYLTSPLSALVLAPFAIARVQRLLLQYMIAQYDTLQLRSSLKLAIVEQDFPCGHAAIQDLLEQLATLNELAQTQVLLPQLDVQVFSTPEFMQHPLQGTGPVKALTDLDTTQFDVVLDVSVLRRDGVFKGDRERAANVIVIRNAHYVHYQTMTGVLSAPPIVYRPLVNQLQNEVFEPIDDTTKLLRKFLQDIFRKLDFRPGQLPILNRAVQLKTVIGLLPTGGGKSLTYQLAAMLQPGMTVIIDPIRSLMIDQYNGLRELGIDKCEFINSTLTTAERNFNQHHLLANGQLQFLFVSPERFVIDDFRKALDNAAKDGHCFAYAVIDEVHCVSEWGHDFRTPYLNLGDNAQEFCHTHSGRSVPLFGLTATASFDVLADIERELNIMEDDGNAVVRFENSVRDEINYLVQEVPNTYEGLELLTETAVRQSIGIKKQQAIFRLIEDKRNVLQTFNHSPALNSILEHSYHNYLPLSLKQELLKKVGSDAEAALQFVSQKYHRLHLSGNTFAVQQHGDEKQYTYGIIVFMPHRQGWIGIRSGYSSHGLYDNPDYVYVEEDRGKPVHYFQDETLGYFMGSGDDDSAARVDEESFHHLEQFKSNKASVMVATKAFGMGIDKPDVRLTVHINIPQSIESFVQEAGRAGRDGKLSASVILFNNDALAIGNKGLYHLDKDVLMYFHKNSFRGQVKERVMIFELRSRITYPNTTNLQQLNDQLNELYGSDAVQFQVKPGGPKHLNRIFINTLTGTSIGYVFLDNQTTGIYHDFGDDPFCYQLVEWLKSRLPFERYRAVDALREWLGGVVVKTAHQIGLERMLEEMQVGESKTIPIAFTNRYYSKVAKTKKQFILNPDHQDTVLHTKAVQELLLNKGFAQNILGNLLREAVFDNLDYPEFVESLNIKDSELVKQLLDLDNPYCIELQRAYFLPRSQEDTAKAIYRLLSIGILDSYTIDYQNKLYFITFSKKPEAAYYNALEELIARYTSKNVAHGEVQLLKESKAVDIAAGKATVISTCLGYLTDFIYSKIKEKRLQAIDDMIRLCQTALQISDPLEQNTYVKDEIYYYFNAKYSRRSFIEHTRSGDLKASMPDDLDNGMSTADTIEKYISLVENNETGEFISNIKHLRGSTMRMLRSNPDLPQYRILKSFALFILSDAVSGLIAEAKQELVRGLIDWKRGEDTELNVPSFIAVFKSRVSSHVLNYSVEQAFDDIEDHYYALYYATWAGTFKSKFLQL